MEASSEDCLPRPHLSSQLCVPSTQSPFDPLSQNLFTHFWQSCFLMHLWVPHGGICRKAGVRPPGPSQPGLQGCLLGHRLGRHLWAKLGALPLPCLLSVGLALRVNTVACLLPSSSAPSITGCCLFCITGNKLLDSLSDTMTDSTAPWTRSPDFQWGPLEGRSGSPWLSPCSPPCGSKLTCLLPSLPISSSSSVSLFSQDKLAFDLVKTKANTWLSLAQRSCLDGPGCEFEGWDLKHPWTTSSFPLETSLPWHPHQGTSCACSELSVAGGFLQGCVSVSHASSLGLGYSQYSGHSRETVPQVVPGKHRAKLWFGQPGLRSWA